MSLLWFDVEKIGYTTRITLEAMTRSCGLM